MKIKKHKSGEIVYLLFVSDLEVSVAGVMPVGRTEKLLGYVTTESSAKEYKRQSKSRIEFIRIQKARRLDDVGTCDKT